MRSVIVFALVWCSTSAHHLHSRPRIANGYDAQPTQFPYMVRLETESMVYCGGALIANSWVLTAAHCVYKAVFVYVYLGSTFIDRAEIGYAIWNTEPDISIHPHFSYELFRNDVALIEIPFTNSCSYVAPVPLPSWSSVFSPYVKEYGIASGWGQTLEKTGYSELLQWSHMRIIRLEICKSLDPHVSDSQLCIDTSDKVSLCNGDSGAPLVSETTGELIGILSRGTTTDCLSGFPEVFTRVDHYLQWIEAVTNIALK